MTHEQALKLAMDMAPYTDDSDSEGFRFIGDHWLAHYRHNWFAKTEGGPDIKIALYRIDPLATTVHEYYTPQQTEGEQS